MHGICILADQPKDLTLQTVRAAVFGGWQIIGGRVGKVTGENRYDPDARQREVVITTPGK
ncbi:MAG: hypothetical protein ABSD29_12575 [Verrucomicrobiota bacterium]